MLINLSYCRFKLRLNNVLKGQSFTEWMIAAAHICPEKTQGALLLR